MSDDSTSLDLIDHFQPRHIGPRPSGQATMLAKLGLQQRSELVDQVVPKAIRSPRPLDLPSAKSEAELLAHMRELASRNQVWRSYLGLGYHNTLTPTVILRNVLENPSWYTQYTPYQAEISQGRLEALLNYQTLVCDLTGLPVANASLLDEGTAAAEAMTLALRAAPKKLTTRSFFVSKRCHPQTIAVIRTRAEPLDINVIVGDEDSFDFTIPVFGVMLSYPDTEGRVRDPLAFFTRAKNQGACCIAVADLLALTLFEAPGKLGAEVVVGNSQRFGVPLGFGGPHAAFMATTEDHKRNLPGRVVGMSRDRNGKPALRLALQAREQHIRRDRATSNICTAQVLLAVTASMYAVYHGPEGLKRIATRLRKLTLALSHRIQKLGFEVLPGEIFDTIKVLRGPLSTDQVIAAAAERKINLRRHDDGGLGLALDETVRGTDLIDILEAFGDTQPHMGLEEAIAGLEGETAIQGPIARISAWLEHPVFKEHRSETEMLRYIHTLASRDLSLTHSMIPLGSCTMKLNATSEMIPVTMPGFGAIHPFAPIEQTQGYVELFRALEADLAEITGFAAVSLQPNAGSQGEYAGLLAIRGYHRARGDSQRDICLIPTSAHGTNPASAAMVGLNVIGVNCDEEGNVDIADLRAKAEKHAARLSTLMITYPSTHGVFEEGIREICEIVHSAGGQVYLDGANMNALVGLCRPGEFGADVCHLNLHKTFCIPHGGGGPGVGPIGVREHLAPYLPGHPLQRAVPGETGPVSAAPWGSASILPISYAYIRMMGGVGLTAASEVAILSANYIAARLAPHYPILYKGQHGRVAHECIIDLRGIQKSSGVTVEDVAKRLMDYGFHAPTMSWPVAGTLMIEPTESESLPEIDRFCDAMIAIRAEIARVESGEWSHEDNPLHNAPHTLAVMAKSDWPHPYSREQAAFPTPWVMAHKFWPFVSRIDGVYGDRNLICSCPSVTELAALAAGEG